MNFLNPFFLIGLIAVGIPVLIHLINLRRPTRLPFSNLSFFKELQTSTIRRIQVKRYLLLALRTAALLALALALARPFLAPDYFSPGGSKQPKALAIVIDNSPGMDRIGSGGPYIEQAKSIARSLIANAGNEDRFLVTTTNGALPERIFSTMTRALEQVEEIKVSNSGNYLHETLSRAFEQFRQVPFEVGITYLITDAQKSQLEIIEKIDEPSKKMGLQLIKVGSENTQNVAVTGLSLRNRLLSAGSPFLLRVEVTNFGRTPVANQYISLEAEERMVGQYELDLEGGAAREFIFELVPQNTGDLRGNILIEGDEITFDNSRYFVVNIPESRSVLYLHDENGRAEGFSSYIRPALAAAAVSGIQLQYKEQAIEAVESNWLSYDVIIFDGVRSIPEYWFDDLQRYVQEGKGVIFIPSERGNIENYNRFLGLFNAGVLTDVRGEYGSFRGITGVAALEEGHPVLEGVFEKQDDEAIDIDLPRIFYYYSYQPRSNVGSFVILETETGDELLVEHRFGNGHFIASTFGADPGWSSFPVNPLFAPLVNRTILYSASSEQGGIDEHILGNRFERVLPGESQTIEMELNEFQARPEVQGVPEGVRVRYSGTEWTPGFLHIQGENRGKWIAVNQNILESDFTPLEEKKLEELSGTLFNSISMIETEELSAEALDSQLASTVLGKEIWNWFIWAAFVLLLSETVVAKGYKAENILQ